MYIVLKTHQSFRYNIVLSHNSVYASFPFVPKIAGGGLAVQIINGMIVTDQLGLVVLGAGFQI